MTDLQSLGGRTAALSLVAAMLLLALSMSAAHADTTPKAPPLATGLPGEPSVADEIHTAANSPGLADVFAGDVTQPDGTVTVYVRGEGLRRMQATIAGFTDGSSANAYTLVRVDHTLATLTSLTMRIAADHDALASSGIQLREWGPDVERNAVDVAVADDAANAAQVLSDRYGDAVVVTQATGPAPERAANRYYDSPPFYDGIRVFFENDTQGPKCTAGFAFIGINSGRKFQLTSGHCGGASVWTNLANHQKIGDVSTVYFGENGFDMESFPCDCGPYVWYEGPGVGTSPGKAHLIAGQCTTCGLGTQVAFDGADTGEVPGATVNGNNQCVLFSDGRTTCYLKRAYKSSEICRGGDSGGPVYQRAANNYVYADGIIVGNTTDGTTCWYHDMDKVLPKVNGYLLD